MVHRWVCPGCGRRLRASEGCTDLFLTCPHCLVGVVNPANTAGTRPEPQPRITIPDVDVRRDQRGTRWAMSVLVPLGALGLVSALVFSLGSLWRGVPGPLAGLVLAVLVVTVVSAARIYHYEAPKPPAGGQGVGRLFKDTLFLFGVVIAAPLLLVAAIVIGFFTICL